jgi:iron complex transport system substrate-binding protein
MKFSFALFVLLAAVGLLAASPAAAQEAGFPVTVEHKFGSTTITEAPQRVVAIGYTEQDYLLALGVMPVAVRSWYADETIAFLPWAEDEAAALGGDTPEILVMPFGNLNYESILALRPDLISAVTSGITQEEYDLLTQIAPTIAQSGEYVDFGMPWQEITRTIGLAVGKAEAAEALVADVEAMLDTVRDENPEFDGKTIAVAYNYGEARTYGYYTAQDGRGRFFTDLGFVVPEELNTIAGEQFYADISAERIDLLDQDVLVFLGLGWAEAGQEGIEGDPIIQQLDVYRNDRIVFVPLEYDDALQYSSPLSLEFALEGIVPLLADAVAGDASVACEPGMRPFALTAETMGCVPEDPQRVVTITDSDLDAVLALGIEPIGVTNGRGQMTPARYLTEMLPESTVVVGNFFNPNLELVLELDPDIILAAGLSDPAVLEQLNAIAPTVDTYSAGWDWQTHFRTVANALNKTAEAEEFLAGYAQRIKTLQSTLADHLGEEFIVARWSAEGPQVMAPITFVSAVLFDLGLTSPESIPDLQAGHAHSAPLSLETLGVIDVDWAFVGTLQAEGDAVDALMEVIENPLFRALEVVQNNRLFIIDGSLWTSSGGPLATMLVLDDVEAAMLEEGE